MGSSRASSESLDRADKPFLADDHETLKEYSNRNRASGRVRWAVTIPWVLCVFLLMGIVLQAVTLKRYDGSPIGYWRTRELEVAKREISPTMKQIRFTTGLRYNESQQLYRETEPGILDYAGHPSPAIDSAWHELISTSDVFLTDIEAQEIIKKDGTFTNLPQGDLLYTDPFSGLYQAVPTVFHDLHCLDQIRRAVYVDYYPQDRLKSIFWPHLQHCIDTLRQSIMCHGDMTPIPEAYTDHKPNGHAEPIFQVEHTCRDYGAIQEWGKGRDALDEKVWRKNAERLKPGAFAR